MYIIRLPEIFLSNFHQKISFKLYEKIYVLSGTPKPEPVKPVVAPKPAPAPPEPAMTPASDKSGKTPRRWYHLWLW